MLADKTSPIPTTIVQIHKAKRLDSFATVLHSPSKFPQSLGDIGSRWLEDKVEYSNARDCFSMMSYSSACLHSCHCFFVRMYVWLPV